jgi:dihydropteroate synthase
MEYHEAANRLFGLRRYGPKPGLESTADLLAAVGDPHEGLDCVQVAGSNGKGSTARMLEATLREAGLSVGLFTSPHLSDVRERCRVDGRMIPKAAVAEFVDDAWDHVTDRAAGGEPPTFFEACTAMALWWFDRADVDVAVLEVGIGGRLDATSVVDPVAAAVTAVSLEHTDVLGDTVAEIAGDKAHVAPADAPLVTATGGEALAAVREQAGGVLTVGDGDDAAVTATYGGRANHTEAAVSLAGDGWSVDTRVPLVGAVQARNAGVAAALARQVADVTEPVLARGLRKAHWPGRFEVMDDAPLTVLDSAHNPAAAAAVADALAEFDHETLHLVVGAMHDKDLSGIAEALPAADRVLATRPDMDRAEDPAVLASAFRAAGADEVAVEPAVPSAVEAALEAAGPDDAVVVTGSLFTVAEARERWTAAMVPKRVDSLAQSAATLSDADVSEPGVWRMRAKGVHRTVRARVRPRQARYLKEELLSIGGECATSGVREDEEFADVVMMGTLAQFNRLLEKLEGQAYGLETVGERLRRTLDIRTDDDAGQGYPWEDATAVMGILNVTPDSFHDGGEYDQVDEAVARAERLVAAGADVLDVGGESTRPGADPVPVPEEIDRVVPVVEELAEMDALVSVDTRKAAVAEAALEAGADVLNDVSGLEDPEMRFLAAEHDVPIVVMHSIDAPVDPDANPDYDDVVEDVVAELTERVLLAEKAGLDREQILVDPGVGFGKTATESLELLDRLGEFRALGCPVLVGHSHKSLFGAVGAEPGDALEETIAATALAADRGADVVRVHDVPENVAAVRTAAALADPDSVAED